MRERYRAHWRGEHVCTKESVREARKINVRVFVWGLVRFGVPSSCRVHCLAHKRAVVAWFGQGTIFFFVRRVCYGFLSEDVKYGDGWWIASKSGTKQGSSNLRCYIDNFLFILQRIGSRQGPSKPLVWSESCCEKYSEWERCPEKCVLWIDFVWKIEFFLNFISISSSDLSYVKSSEYCCERIIDNLHQILLGHRYHLMLVRIVWKRELYARENYIESLEVRSKSVEKSTLQIFLLIVLYCTAQSAVLKAQHDVLCSTMQYSTAKYRREQHFVLCSTMLCEAKASSALGSFAAQSFEQSFAAQS